MVKSEGRAVWPFRECAKPWMAKLKRHMDVPKERFPEGLKRPAQTPKLKRPATQAPKPNNEG